MATSEELYQRGLEIRRQLSGGQPAATPSAPSTYDMVPGLGRLVTESLFGGIWGRPALDIKHRSMTTVSALTVLGRAPQLRGHVRNALNLGITKEQVAEIMVHLILYGGLPASLNALTVAQEVFDETPQEAYNPAPIAAAATPEERYQQGIEVRRQLFGEQGVRWAASAAEELLPDVVHHVNEYLFGTIWSRPTLDLKSRVVCTLSALTVLGREAQIRNHVRAALHLGFTKQEVSELLAHTIFYGGLPASLNALRVAKEVFGEVGA